MAALLDGTAGVTPDSALVSVGDGIDVDVEQGYLRCSFPFCCAGRCLACALTGSVFLDF